MRNDPDGLRATIQRAALNADVIISSGGVSVGEAEFVREVLNKIGDVAFWTLAIRPGRPLAIGQIGPAAYSGLPGNPVAVLGTFLFLVSDALLRLAGATPSEDNLTKGISKPSARAHKVQDDYGPWSKPIRSSSCQPIGETGPRANPSTR